MSHRQAMDKLAEYGYGPVSARGLLLLAERSGSYSDGNLTVGFRRDDDYYVEA